MIKPFYNNDLREKRGWLGSVVLGMLAVVMLGLASAAHAAPAAKLVQATGLHVTTAGNLTQVQVDLTGQVTFDTRTSSEGRIVIVKIKDLDFSLPTGAGKISKGVVQRIRYGKMPDGHSEIAIDAGSSVSIRKTYLAVGKVGKRVRMTLVLAPVAQVAAETETADAATEEVTGSLPAATAVATAPDGHKRVIVIDPGHGGIDPGAVSAGGIKEKDVVLSFAADLKAALEANGGFDVVLTREDDTFQPLQARVEFARAKRADLFIAVHADKINNSAVRGTTLYLLSDTASDAEAEALAQKENLADAIAGINLQEQSATVADVLVELAQRESRNKAAMFAENAVSHLKPATIFTGKALRSAGFVVLKAPDVPSVLVELGYLSNTKDAKNLNDDGWRRKVARSLADAVSSHFSNVQNVTAQASP